jgi:aldehyde oxidoreductase
MNDPSKMISFVLNGQPISVPAEAAERRLVDVLRDELGLTGTKEGCGEGTCGTCTVLVDGRPTKSCVTKVSRIEGRSVQTIEGVASGDTPHPLQEAFVDHGAIQCGFCTPGMILASKALLDRNPEPTREEIKRALRGNLCRCTGYQKIVDAVEAAARTPHGSPPTSPDHSVDPAASSSRESWVGRSVLQEGVWDKALGLTTFGADVTPEGCVHLKVVRSTEAHARITAVQSARALAVPGVLAVLTARDIKGTNRTGPFQRDKPVLAEDRVRYVGDPVALVAATDPSAAEAGAREVQVSYENLPAATTSDQALAAEAAPLHQSGNLLAEWHLHKGDADAGMAAAAVTAEGAFHTARQEHGYLEPEAGIAWMEHGRVVIRLSTQNPHEDQEQVAAALGLPPDRIRVIQAPTGGAFGGKTSYDLAALLALGATALARPVKLVFSRSESLATTEKRHPFHMRIKVGADAGGRLTALEADLVADTGAYASYGKGVAERAATHISGPYEIPAMTVRSRSVYTNTVPAGAMRGYGAPQASFATESVMDMLADKLGLDPIEIRRRNVLRVGSTTATGQVLTSSVGAAATLEAVAPKYEEARAWAAQPSPSGARRGVGIASVFFGISESGKRTDSQIALRLTAEGTVQLLAGAADLGQGVYSVLRQITADTLHAPWEAIAVVTPDTDLMPSAGATEASRQTLVSGRAAEFAAQQLRARLEALSLSCDPSTDWRAYAQEAYRALVRDGRPTIEVGRYETQNQPIDKTGRGAPHEAYAFAAHVAQVEVDPGTGAIRVVRMVTAHDVGHPVNPRALEGQIEGGLLMGLGMAVFEDYAPGRTMRFADYRMPRCTDLPEIVNIILDEECPDGPFGAKGVGEVPAVGPASAIANAVANATGTRPHRLPIGLSGA